MFCPIIDDTSTRAEKMLGRLLRPDYARGATKTKPMVTGEGSPGSARRLSKTWSVYLGADYDIGADDNHAAMSSTIVIESSSEIR